MAKEGEKARKETGREVQKITPSRYLSPFEEMERWMENVFPRGWMRPFRWGAPWEEAHMPFEGRVPRVDVVDQEDTLVVRAELPGVKKDDLDISVTDDSVTIKGSTEREEKEEKEDYYRCEISRGAFSRTVPLPADIDADKSKARFQDGVLELTLPKVAKSKRRSVKVE